MSPWSSSGLRSILMPDQLEFDYDVFISYNSPPPGDQSPGYYTTPPEGG